MILRRHPQRLQLPYIKLENRNQGHQLIRSILDHREKWRNTKLQNIAIQKYINTENTEIHSDHGGKYSFVKCCHREWPVYAGLPVVFCMFVFYISMFFFLCSFFLYMLYLYSEMLSQGVASVCWPSSGRQTLLIVRFPLSPLPLESQDTFPHSDNDEVCISVFLYLHFLYFCIYKYRLLCSFPID